jgi:hypothetical protein
VATEQLAWQAGILDSKKELLFDLSRIQHPASLGIKHRIFVSPIRRFEPKLS